MVQISLAVTGSSIIDKHFFFVKITVGDCEDLPVTPLATVSYFLCDSSFTNIFQIAHNLNFLFLDHV